MFVVMDQPHAPRWLLAPAVPGSVWIEALRHAMCPLSVLGCGIGATACGVLLRTSAASGHHRAPAAWPVLLLFGLLAVVIGLAMAVRSVARSVRAQAEYDAEVAGQRDNSLRGPARARTPTATACGRQQVQHTLPLHSLFLEASSTYGRLYGNKLLTEPEPVVACGVATPCSDAATGAGGERSFMHRPSSCRSSGGGGSGGGADGSTGVAGGSSQAPPGPAWERSQGSLPGGAAAQASQGPALVPNGGNVGGAAAAAGQPLPVAAAHAANARGAPRQQRPRTTVLVVQPRALLLGLHPAAAAPSLVDASTADAAVEAEVVGLAAPCSGGAGNSAGPSSSNNEDSNSAGADSTGNAALA